MQHPQKRLAECGRAAPARQTQRDCDAGSKLYPGREAVLWRGDPDRETSRRRCEHGPVKPVEWRRHGAIRLLLREPIVREARNDPAADEADEHEKRRHAKPIPELGRRGRSEGLKM